MTTAVPTENEDSGKTPRPYVRKHTAISTKKKNDGDTDGKLNDSGTDGKSNTAPPRKNDHGDR